MKRIAFLLVLAVVLNVAVADGNTYYAAASVHNVVEGSFSLLTSNCPGGFSFIQPNISSEAPRILFTD
jgi:hypothetical protein